MPRIQTRATTRNNARATNMRKGIQYSLPEPRIRFRAKSPARKDVTSWQRQQESQQPREELQQQPEDLPVEQIYENFERIQQRQLQRMQELESLMQRFQQQAAQDQPTLNSAQEQPTRADEILDIMLPD